MSLRTARRLRSKLPLPTAAKRRLLRALRAPMGLAQWPQDVLRHTAATYLLAKHRDAAAVALQLGNSPRILLQHYHALAPKAHAAAFWRIRPK